MAKSSGLGDRLLVGGYNLSGDIGALDSITTSVEEIEQTGIDKSAKERICGQRDGAMEFTSFFNDAAGQAHPALSALPRTDRVVTYLRGTTQGNAGAAMVAKQIGYDGERDDKGSLTFKVEALANGYGLDWGRQLTAGIETCANSLTGQNAGFEGGIGTWVNGGNATLAASSAQAHAGTGSLAITATGAGTAIAQHITGSTTGFAITAGRAYYMQSWFRAATTARTIRVGVNWFTAGGSLVTSSTVGASTDTTAGWTLAANLFVAPATAAFAVVLVLILAPANGEVHYVDDVSFVPMPAGLSSPSGASTAFGLQAYLQVTAFTGTDATIKLQESSDDAATDAYADVTGGAFTAVTAVGAERIATSATQTIERYLRPVVTTTGGFSVLNYNLVVVRNETAPVI